MLRVFQFSEYIEIKTNFKRHLKVILRLNEKVYDNFIIWHANEVIVPDDDGGRWNILMAYEAPAKKGKEAAVENKSKDKKGGRK